MGESIIKTGAERYRNCEQFTYKCIACKTETAIAKPINKVDSAWVPALQACSNKECSVPPYNQLSNIRNHLSLAIRKHIRRFYENWMVCDDPNCNQNTRIYGHVTHNNRPVCLACKQGLLLRAYSEGDLYTQLQYYQYIFDLKKLEQTRKYSID